VSTPVLERRIHRMEHDKPGKPLRVVREAHALASQADPQPPAPNEEQEDEMPKGQYDRSKAKPRKPREAKAEGEGPKKRTGRKARAAKVPRASSKARFGVFSDGSVQIDAPGCKGNLSGADVRLLVEFVKKLER
jgi:hypothetical protein